MITGEISNQEAFERAKLIERKLREAKEILDDEDNIEAWVGDTRCDEQRLNNAWAHIYDAIDEVKRAYR